jgi:hypothetical protein
VRSRPYVEDVAAYATVLFFCLYRACIWSIRGTWPCRVSLGVVSHLRAGASVGLRVRGTRERDRAHDEQVQESNARSDWVRRGDAKDIIEESRGLRTRLAIGGVMMPRKFAAGICRFGMEREKLGTFRAKDSTSSSTLSRRIYFSGYTRAKSQSSFRHILYLVPAPNMADSLCGVCNAEPKKYKCPICTLP